MPSLDAVVWLVAVEVAIGAVGLAVLGFYVWKARALADQLVKLTAGANWQADRTTEAFAQAAGSIDLATPAAWSASAACQAAARDLRPVGHGDTTDDHLPHLDSFTGPSAAVGRE